MTGRHEPLQLSVFFVVFLSQRDDERLRPGACAFSDVSSVCANRALMQGDWGGRMEEGGVTEPYMQKKKER